MARLDEALLQGFISRRLTPDVQDRLDIEDELASLEADIEALQSRPVRARLQTGKLRSMRKRHGYLTTAHRVAVEHVRANPVQAAIYREEQSQRAAANRSGQTDRADGRQVGAQLTEADIAAAPAEQRLTKRRADREAVRSQSSEVPFVTDQDRWLIYRRQRRQRAALDRGED